MGRQRYVFRERKDGTVACLALDGPPESRKDRDLDSMSFHERVFRAYYDAECQGKTPWKAEWSKDKVKRVHEQAIARGE